MNVEALLAGPVVTVDEMLRAKEQRAARQQHALTCYRLPVISVTLVTPGAVKNTAAWQRLMACAQEAIAATCRSQEWACVWESDYDERTGPVWMAALCAPPKALKRAMCELEENHPLGRLWDIDVLDVDGESLSRRALGLPARKCLICNEEAHSCARSRRHALSLLLKEIAHRIEQNERSHNPT